MSSADLLTASPSAWPGEHPWELKRLIPSRMAHIAATFSDLVRNGFWKNLAQMSWDALFGTSRLVLLRLDLGSFQSERLRRSTLTARPIQPKDMPVLFPRTDQNLTIREQRESARRLSMLRANIKTCYVVEDSQGNARFLQWLIPSSQNDNIRNTYGKWYPSIAADEAMIEYAFVLPKYRGTGLLPCAVAEILEVARAQGIRHIVTFIPTWNNNSMQSFIRLGFRPSEHRFDQKIFGFRFRRTVPLLSNSTSQRGPSLSIRSQIPTVWQIVRISLNRARRTQEQTRNRTVQGSLNVDKIPSRSPGNTNCRV